MGIHRLEEVEKEKELGVLIHRTLSVSNNCAVAVKKANHMAGHLYKTSHMSQKHKLSFSYVLKEEKMGFNLVQTIFICDNYLQSYMLV